VISGELPRAVDLLGELFTQSVFPAEELEKERRLLLAELKAKEEDPFPWGIRRLVAVLFTKHPYRLDPSGDPKSVADLKREDLVAFYRKLLNPSQMVVSVVGDFNRQNLLDLLKKTLGKCEARKPEPVSVPKEPPLTSLRERLEITPRQEGLVMIGFPGLSVDDPRVPVLDLMETILSGGAGRLFSEVREQRGLAYTVGAFALPGVDPGAFILYAVTEPSNLPTVREALLEEVRRLRGTPVPEEEFKEAQQGLLGSRRIARQTQGSLASQMGLDELYGLGFDFYKKYDARVQAVTPLDVQALAKELLDPERCVVVIGQPQGGSRAANETSQELAETAAKK